MTTGRSEYVDYERIADLYRQGRFLPREVLDRWAAAVRPHLPNGPLRVADVGAGTGVFAHVWPQWSPGSVVVAVEPTEAMGRAGHDAGHGDAQYVRGVAEALPIRDHSIDVVWISTALHHFADLRRSAAEVGRVLAGGGRVFVRTFLPERTEIGWLDIFAAPGSAARATADGRFHRVDQLADLFGPHGMVVAHVCDVHEFTYSFGETADWIERMRHADSWLTAFTDREIADGLQAMRAMATTPARNDLSLVVFSRQ